MNGEDVLRAFADDTAVVIEDYRSAIPTFCRLFSEFGKTVGLCLNIVVFFSGPME